MKRKRELFSNGRGHAFVSVGIGRIGSGTYVQRRTDGCDGSDLIV